MDKQIKMDNKIFFWNILFKYPLAYGQKQNVYH